MLKRLIVQIEEENIFCLISMGSECGIVDGYACADGKNFVSGELKWVM